MKYIGVVVGFLCLLAGRAHSGVFEDQVQAVNEQVAGEASGVKTKVEASQAQQAAVVNATTLRCFAHYDVDYRREKNSVGIEFWLIPTSRDLDAGISYEGNGFPNFSVDLKQFEERQKNKAGSSGRTLTLIGGQKEDTKVLPLVDVSINPYYVGKLNEDDSKYKFEGFTVRISQVKQSKASTPAEKRIGSTPYDGIYARSTEVQVKAVSGTEFKVGFDSLVDGVRDVEFECDLK